MATPTIWGTAQHVLNLCRGVRSVSTASHGGILVSKGFAEKYLPKEILACTPFMHGCYQFEEDGEAYTPMFFQPNLIIKLTESFGSKDKESLKRHFKYTYQGIVHWHPEYMEKYAKQADQFKFFAMGALQFTREQVEELLADKEA